jgi:hypothetical protein
MRLPELKAPKFLTDLGRELRDRRLLPLIAVLAVAIVAVPIALSKSTPQPQSDGQSLLGAALAAKASQHLTAVPDAPGLRDYHRRLKGLQATNPFEPPASESSSQEQPASSESSGGEEPASISASSSPESTSTTATNGGATSGEATSAVHIETKYFTHAVDVRIVNSAPGATSSQSKPVVRHNLPTLSELPGRKAPAVVFMGADGKRALMLISAGVQPVAGGDGHCALLSAGVCQLMLLKPGQVEAFAYGESNHTVRIKLLKISLVVTHRPR